MIVWKPNEVRGWGYGDSWNNEFTTADDKELTPEEFEAYYAWSNLIQVGMVVSRTDELVTIELETPGVGDRKRVAYPRFDTPSHELLYAMVEEMREELGR